METRVSKHVFHGFYSSGTENNYGYGPRPSIDKKLANFPIHFYRASYGEKDGETVKEFKTEEEVLKWYKKKKYGSQFDDFEFPKDFCKNYIIFSESEFHRNSFLFHGMIKGLKITSDLMIESEGEVGLDCPPCNEDEEENNNTPQNTSKYNQKIQFNINFDSTKIFNINELQKRLPANNFKYETEAEEENDKNVEKLRSFNKEVFQENWKFNEKEFKSIFEFDKQKFNFNTTFINDPVILSQSNFFLESTPLSIDISNIFNRNNNEYTDETVNKQKSLSKKFQKFGSIEYKFQNTNSVINSASCSFNFNLSDLFYIKEKKVYLCFIELDNTISFSGRIVDKLECEECSSSSSSQASPTVLTIESLNIILSRLFQKSIDPSLEISSILSQEEEDYLDLGSTNFLNVRPTLTTRDNANRIPNTYTSSQCDSSPKKLEFQKTKCTIQLLNNKYEIELFKLKDDEFVYDNSDCEDAPFFKNKIKINYNTMPIFEIVGWNSSDFDNKNIFPPKVS